VVVFLGGRLGARRGAGPRAPPIDQLLARSFDGRVPPMHDSPRDAWWRITLSSGTTGRPKGIVSTHAAIVNVHLLRTVYPAGPGDVVVIPMGASMTLAVHNWLRCLYSGACAMLAEKMPAPDLFRLLQGDKPTHCIGTPAVANAMAAESAKAGAPPPSAGKRLHTFSVGGGRISAGVRDALRKHICPNVLVHYGGAEMQIVAVLDPALADARPACSGRILPWIEVHAVDEAGLPLPAGGEGRLRLRSPAIASCYVGDSDNSAFSDGWFLSQDRGVVTPDGLVFLSGRANDVINFEGFKFDPEVMEEAIMADRNIMECAVVEVPGRVGSQLVAIIVDPSGSADVEALAGRCEKPVPGMRLRHVLRTEKLPRNANGKVMRMAVRRSVEEMLKAGGDPAPRP
jgi:acyl-coenzyme A synthetase/AMP-(fatty) acid ligase